MAFQLSPGVVVTEQDRTTVVPTVATTSGGFAGAFQWGPVEEVTTVDSETNLVNAFGKPNDTTAGYFFTAANFLSYGNNLKVAVVRGLKIKWFLSITWTKNFYSKYYLYTFFFLEIIWIILKNLSNGELFFFFAS